MVEMEINELPVELLQEIFSYLNIKQKLQCERVCRKWQENVLIRVKSLAFGEVDDLFHGYHKHLIGEQIGLPCRELAYAEKIYNCIFSKVGRNLHCFQGRLFPSLTQIIIKFCKDLHCLNVHVAYSSFLTKLIQTYGKQLTCVTLHLGYTMTSDGIDMLISQCPKLISLAVAFPRGRMNQFNVTTPHSEPLPSFKSLRNLVINYVIEQELLKQILMFTQLEMVGLEISEEINSSSEWATLLTKLSGLKALAVTFTENVEHPNLMPLPQNLEYLSLKWNGNHDVLSGKLPKLKTLVVILHYWVPLKMKEALLNALHFCPKIEKLSIGIHDLPIDCDNLDAEFAPLLSFIYLRQLILTSDFVISDSFCSRINAELHQLTTFGSHVRDGPLMPQSLVPCGQLFWNSVRDKALSRPKELFSVIGELSLMKMKMLFLDEPFPANVLLVLRGMASVQLRNGFGRSLQWQKWTSHWSQLTMLTIEIVDVSFKLSGLPVSIRILNVNCWNENKNVDNEPLTFESPLPNLVKLDIFQKNMTNLQLRSTAECVAKCCPNVNSLQISRKNQDHDLADNSVSPLLKCRRLQKVAFNANIKISSEYRKHFKMAP